MGPLTPEGRITIDGLALRHGFGPEAVLALAGALERGGGAQAQFSHAEFGGMGQWSRGGMIMIGDMFNHGLKARVDALCSDLADACRSNALFAAAPGRESTWWPAALGAPASSGSQNGMGYACFPQARQLAVRRDGQVSLYHTGDHRISGVSQAQGGTSDLVFTSQHGPVRLLDLASVDGATQPRPEVPREAPPETEASRRRHAAPQGDAFASIEALHGLFQKGILTEAEYSAKKKQLLDRL